MLTLYIKGVSGTLHAENRYVGFEHILIGCRRLKTEGGTTLTLVIKQTVLTKTFDLGHDRYTKPVGNMKDMRDGSEV